MRETIITNTREKKWNETEEEEKTRQEKKKVISMLVAGCIYLQVISKDHCQNRSQKVFVPEDEADVDERWVDCNGIVGWRKFARNEQQMKDFFEEKPFENTYKIDTWHWM